MITINITYTGEGQSAKAFMHEMIDRGVVERIRKEPGNIRYEYFIPVDRPDAILLIDAWECQEALDAHHTSPMMKTIAGLREKYDLHMQVERYVAMDDNTGEEFIRK